MSAGDGVPVLHRQFGELFQERRYGEALTVAEAAVEDARRVHGDDSIMLSSSLKLASLANRALGSFGAAEELLERSLAIDRVRFGEHDLRFGQALLQLARLHREMGRTPEATAGFRRVLDVFRRAPGAARDLATASVEAGEFLFHVGDYAAAADVFERGLDSAVEVAGPRHPFTAVLLNDLGLCEKQLYRFAAAEGHYLEALAIRREALGESHPVVAESLRNLALLRQEMGDYPAARGDLVKAIDVLRLHLPPDHPEIARATADLGALEHAMGDLVAARTLLAEGLELQRLALGDHDPAVARSLSKLGALTVELGQLDEGERLLSQALEILRTQFGETHPETASALNNLARVRQLAGDYVEAERLYRHVLAMRLETLPGTDPRIVTSLVNLASVFQDMGSYAAAYEPLSDALERARSAGGEHSLDVALCWNNLGEVYRAAGRDHDAQAATRRALEIRRSRLGEDHPLVTATLNNLALTTEDPEAARALYEDALRAAQRHFGDRHESVGLAHGNLATHLWVQGEYGQAEVHSRRAVEIARAVLPDAHPSLSRDLHNLALILAATGRDREALDRLLDAVRIDDALIAQVFAVGSERQRLDLLLDLWIRHCALLSLVWHRFAEDSEAVAQAFGVVLRRKALSADVFAVQRHQRGAAADAGPAEQELAALRAVIAKQTLEEGAAADREQLRRWIARRDELEARLARAVPAAHFREMLERVGPAAVAEALPAESVLVEYVQIAAPDLSAGFTGVAPERYIAFVLPARDVDGLRVISIPGDHDAVDEAIARFRASVTGGDRDFASGSPASRPASADVRRAEVREAGKLLREVVFDPVCPALRGRRRAYLAPDGALTCLPFEALPAGDGGFVIDDYVLSYVTSGRDLLDFGSPGGACGTAVVGADPAFDLGAVSAPAPAPGRRSRDVARSGRFTPLAGAREEGELIARLLGVEAWLGEDVLERRIRRSRSPWILHLATHGAFLPDQAPGEEAMAPAGLGTARNLGNVENPLLRSFLALAGANTWLRGESPPEDAEDGMLNAEDVAGMDLEATELVVLSACETGLGSVRVGEGVFGLRRAFLVAGAKTLIMSLWKVPDRETRALMERFYEELLGGAGRAEALREAQLAVKRRHASDPLYWGGFVCEGDPGPMPRPALARRSS